MQENLILTIITPNISLQSRNRIRNINSHARRPTHKDTRPPPKDALSIHTTSRHLLQHVSEIRTSVFGAPAFLLYLLPDEGEAHEVLLEFGRCGREAEVEG